MEQIVFAELEKQKVEFVKLVKARLNNHITDEELEFITENLSSCIINAVTILKERKSAHDKYFSDIILNSIDGIIGYDQDGNIFLWNKGAEKIFGYQRDEIRGKDFFSLMPEHIKKKGDAKEISRILKEIGYISNYETEYITKAGDIRYISIAIFQIKSEQEKFIGNVSIVRDMTNERKLKDELREKENLALIGTVVSSIAHNLSNPLNIISGNADYLLLDRKEGDEGFDELKVIIQETTRITKSIRQILNFSRPLILIKEKCIINDLIAGILSNSNYLSDGKNIDFIQNLKEDIPECLIDKEQFRDVLLNLITNSVQAIKSKGKIIITSKTVSINNSDFINIEISDTGTGIKPEDINNIFIPFFSTKEYGKGTGLGLAFSDRVIKEHKGFIEVESQPNSGTTFKIYIPL